MFQGLVVEKVSAGFCAVSLLDKAHGEIGIERLPAYACAAQEVARFVQSLLSAVSCNRDVGLLSNAATSFET